MVSKHFSLNHEVNYIVGSSSENFVYFEPPKNYRYLKSENTKRITTVLNEITNFNPEFLLLTGGLTNRAQVPEIEEFFSNLNILVEQNIPVAFSLGTTDIYYNLDKCAVNDGPITIPTPNVCLRTLWRLFFAIIEHGIKPQFLSREFRSDYSYILDANHGAYGFNMLKDSNKIRIFKTNVHPVFNVKTTTGAWDGIKRKSRFLFPFEKMWTQDGKRFWPELPCLKQSDYENIKSSIESMYNSNEI